MYNNYYNPMYRGIDQYAMSSPQMKGRPVSSIDEVRAAQIDFDGSISIFPDYANKKIYTKQIGLDGIASIKVYTQAEDASPTLTYVTKEELDSAILNLQNLINEGKEVKSNESKSSTTSGSAAFSF